MSRQLHVDKTKGLDGALHKLTLHGQVEWEKVATDQMEAFSDYWEGRLLSFSECEAEMSQRNMAIRQALHLGLGMTQSEFSE